MATFLGLVFGAGIVLMTVAGIVLLVQLGNVRARRLIRTRALTPVAGLAPGRRRIATEGVTEPGPAGPQVAPVTENDCVWYRTQLLRRPSRHRGEDAPAHDVLYDITSPDWPGLADRTGAVLFDPELLTRNHHQAGHVRDRVEREHPGGGGAVTPGRFGELDVRRDETLVIIEEWIPRRRPAYVLGRAGRSPDGRLTLRPGRRGIAVFVQGDRASALRRYHDELVTGGRLVGGAFLSGLVLAGGAAGLLYATY